MSWCELSSLSPRLTLTLTATDTYSHLCLVPRALCLLVRPVYSTVYSVEWQHETTHNSLHLHKLDKRMTIIMDSVQFCRVKLFAAGYCIVTSSQLSLRQFVRIAFAPSSRGVHNTTCDVLVTLAHSHTKYTVEYTLCTLCSWHGAECCKFTRK